MKVKRIAPGLYDIETTIGTFELHRSQPVEDRGYGTTPEWYLQWPNRPYADAVFATKREAVEAVAAELEI